MKRWVVIIISKFIFTFGAGQTHEGYYQPIYAKTYTEAKNKMVSIYGYSWASEYSEEEWKSAERDGYAIEQPLEEIYC